MAGNIAENFEAVQQRIVAAAERAGRDPQSVRLVCITKEATLDQVRALYDLGAREFGENRIDVAAPKVAALPSDLLWHFIAPVQRRKAKDVVALFHHADGVDRVEAAVALQKRCEEQERTLKVLVEVNVSGEASKHGFAPPDLASALETMRALDRLQVEGLMTMAPFDAAPGQIRSIFRQTREAAERHNLRELSMGMSNDFEIGVEEGATQVRVGSLLFT